MVFLRHLLLTPNTILNLGRRVFGLELPPETSTQIIFNLGWVLLNIFYVLENVLLQNLTAHFVHLFLKVFNRPEHFALFLLGCKTSLNY